MSACPKPTPPSVLRARRKRADEDRAAIMRAQVWARDISCRLCGRWVRPDAFEFFKRGEVHHLRGRRVAPRDVLNPNTCVLLCGTCHLKITAHEIEVTGTTASTFRRVR